MKKKYVLLLLISLTSSFNIFAQDYSDDYTEESFNPPTDDPPLPISSDQWMLILIATSFTYANYRIQKSKTTNSIVN